MEDRLAVPKALHTVFQDLFHSEHSGCDEALRKSSDFWWLQIHRDVMLCVEAIKECIEAGEKFQPIRLQTH